MTTVSRASGEQGTPVPAPQKTMLAYAKDLPNICSLVGLLCAVLAIYYAVRGVFPAAVLLSYGHFSLWFIPGAFIVVAIGAIRLSYFNVFGLVRESTYMGLALDNNVIILVFVFLFSGLVGQAGFAVALYVLLIVLAGLNVAPIKTRKFAGRWYYALIAYTLTMSVIYGWQLHVSGMIG